MTNSQLRLATQNINSAVSNIWQESRRPNKNECFSEDLETRAKNFDFQEIFNVLRNSIILRQIDVQIQKNVVSVALEVRADQAHFFLDILEK